MTSLFYYEVYFIINRTFATCLKSQSFIRWLNTVFAVCAKSGQEKGCSSPAETWQVENILMKYFD